MFSLAKAFLFRFCRKFFLLNNFSIVWKNNFANEKRGDFFLENAIDNFVGFVRELRIWLVFCGLIRPAVALMLHNKSCMSVRA